MAWRCYFAVDASGKTPSVSEQRDLGWLIEYWLNCFELWPSSLYSRKVLRFVKWKLLPLIVLGLFYSCTSASHVPLRRLTGRGPGPSCFICAVSTWHLILTLLSLQSQQSLYLSPLILSWHSSFPVDPSAYPNKPHVITWSTPLRGIKWISGECSTSPSSFLRPPITLLQSASSHSCSHFSPSLSPSPPSCYKNIFKKCKNPEWRSCPQPLLVLGFMGKSFHIHTHTHFPLVFPQLHPILTCWNPQQSWSLESHL